MSDPVSFMCAARCASCCSWLSSQLSSLFGGGNGSTITITCRDMFNRMNCCERCNCFQSTTITVQGNLTNTQVEQSTIDKTHSVASEAFKPIVQEQPKLQFVQPVQKIESEV